MMVVLLRNKVDISKEFSREGLSFFQQIGAAWTLLVNESKYMKKSRRMKAEKAKRERLVKEEKLKEVLIITLYNCLMQNSQLKDRGMDTSWVDIAVDRRYIDICQNVLKYKDFSVYQISDVTLDPDLIRAFGDDIPYIFRASRKVIL
jgi:hypothetical protein